MAKKTLKLLKHTSEKSDLSLERKSRRSQTRQVFGEGGLKKGVFITFEGPEGSGKSTHAMESYTFLKRQGYDCVFTREPGGTPAGDAIRNILLSRDARKYALSALAELLLFEASRACIVDEVIVPALKKKRIVICDRFNDSTFAYQGYAGGLRFKDILKIDALATGGLKPDLTILLDVNAKTGLLRAARNKKIDRMESKPLIFHEKVMAGFRALAEKDKKRIKLIEVRESISQTQTVVREEVLRLLRSVSKRSSRLR